MSTPIITLPVVGVTATLCNSTVQILFTVYSVLCTFLTPSLLCIYKCCCSFGMDAWRPTAIGSPGDCTHEGDNPAPIPKRYMPPYTLPDMLFFPLFLLMSIPKGGSFYLVFSVEGGFCEQYTFLGVCLAGSFVYPLWLYIFDARRMPLFGAIVCVFYFIWELIIILCWFFFTQKQYIVLLLLGICLFWDIYCLYITGCMAMGYPVKYRWVEADEICCLVCKRVPKTQYVDDHVCVAPPEQTPEALHQHSTCMDCKRAGALPDDVKTYAPPSETDLIARRRTPNLNVGGAFDISVNPSMNSNGITSVY